MADKFNDPNGSQHKLKIHSMEDNVSLNGHQWMTTSIGYGRRPQWKTTLIEDVLTIRQYQWKMTSMGDNKNKS